MKCGDTFLLYDDDNPIPHLHIVITDPDPNDCVVLVSVTTERSRSDTMTRLAPGVHPSVTDPSVITYAYSKVMSCKQINSLVASGDAFTKVDASAKIVQRAQAGLRETDRAPQEVKEFFLNWWEQHGTPDSN
jgi:hypothetical protein